MTNKQINEAIAEYVGWNWYAVMKDGWYYREGGHGYTSDINKAGKYTKDDAKKELCAGERMGIVRIPSPLYDSDLNAMHEAESKLNDFDYDAYWSELVALCVEKEWERMNSCPANIRAQAFINLINKI